MFRSICVADAGGARRGAAPDDPRRARSGVVVIALGLLDIAGAPDLPVVPLATRFEPRALEFRGGRDGGRVAPRAFFVNETALLAARALPELEVLANAGLDLRHLAGRQKGGPEIEGMQFETAASTHEVAT